MNDRVTELRKALNLTMEKFGARLGVSKVAISRIESGKTSVTERMFKLICKEFGVSAAWLRDGAGEMFTADSTDDALMQAVADLQYRGDNGEDIERQKQLAIKVMKLGPDAWKVLEDFFFFAEKE